MSFRMYTCKHEGKKKEVCALLYLSQKKNDTPIIIKASSERRFYDISFQLLRIKPICKAWSMLKCYIIAQYTLCGHPTA